VGEILIFSLTSENLAITWVLSEFTQQLHTSILNGNRILDVHSHIFSSIIIRFILFYWHLMLLIN